MLYVIATCKPLLFFIFIFIFLFLKIYQNMGQKLDSNKGNQLLFRITVLSHQKRK